MTLTWSQSKRPVLHYYRKPVCLLISLPGSALLDFIVPEFGIYVLADVGEVMLGLSEGRLYQPNRNRSLVVSTTDSASTNFQKWTQFLASTARVRTRC